LPKKCNIKENHPFLAIRYFIRIAFFIGACIEEGSNDKGRIEICYGGTTGNGSNNICYTNNYLSVIFVKSYKAI